MAPKKIWARKVSIGLTVEVRDFCSPSYGESPSSRRELQFEAVDRAVYLDPPCSEHSVAAHQPSYDPSRSGTSRALPTPEHFQLSGYVDSTYQGPASEHKTSPSYTNRCSQQPPFCRLILPSKTGRSPYYIMFLTYQILFVLMCSWASALTSAQWRSQSIYQVMTDRFARTDGSTTASCDVNRYCGGTWQGLINKLDYIQNMGFTAVGILIFGLRTQFNKNRFGSRLLCRTLRRIHLTAMHTTATGRRTSTKSTPTLELLPIWSNCHRLCMQEECT